jgi:L-rhamnose mutarotase
MEKNRYCIVIEIKDEYIEEYKNKHKDIWKEVLEAIKFVGVKEILMWQYKNLSIIYYECENLEKVYNELGKLDIIKQWEETKPSWFKYPDALDTTKGIKTLEKIFDLSQQLKGDLKPY